MTSEPGQVRRSTRFYPRSTWASRRKTAATGGSAWSRRPAISSISSQYCSTDDEFRRSRSIIASQIRHSTCRQRSSRSGPTQRRWSSARAHDQDPPSNERHGTKPTEARRSPLPTSSPWFRLHRPFQARGECAAPPPASTEPVLATLVAAGNLIGFTANLFRPERHSALAPPGSLTRCRSHPRATSADTASLCRPNPSRHRRPLAGGLAASELHPHAWRQHKP